EPLYTRIETKEGAESGPEKVEAEVKTTAVHSAPAS
ncbi:MAG: hypothetical protein JWQ64_2821, partial [Subtercola sp.]|nr:hypothetical protein [Subtercola sp.]